MIRDHRLKPLHILSVTIFCFFEVLVQPGDLLFLEPVLLIPLRQLRLPVRHKLLQCLYRRLKVLGFILEIIALCGQPVDGMVSLSHQLI